MAKTNLGFETRITIGSTLGTMQPVEVEPHVEFQLSEDFEKIVCGKTQATGYPRCRWSYPDMLLSGEEFYQLQSLVGNDASANVYITVPTQSLDVTTYTPQFTTYAAIMNWPSEGVSRVSMNRWEISDGILFTNLEPPS